MARKKKSETLAEEIVESAGMEAPVEETEVEVAEDVDGLTTVNGEGGSMHSGVPAVINGQEHLMCTNAKDGSKYLVHLDKDLGVWVV